MNQNANKEEGSFEREKHENVVKIHRTNKQKGEFESVVQIFSRLPIPRLEKAEYKFIFDNICRNVQSLLKEQDNLQIVKEQEQKLIDQISIKKIKNVELSSESLNNQELRSRKPLFKSLVYLRQQKSLKLDMHEGDFEPFMSDSNYLQVDKIQQQIPNIKLFMEDEPLLKKNKFKFINENQIIFENKQFPSTFELNKRAEILAKIYLLQHYRDQSRKLLQNEKIDEKQIEKKRQFNKMKQEMQKDKLKEGELIESLDLMRQAIRVMELIEKKMNLLSYEEFKNKNGERATGIKKSLQKLKSVVNSEPSPEIKLKILISYKNKKGW